MLLVYTHKITPRLKYIFKQVCTRILGIPVSFTTQVEQFIAHDNIKMSYSNQQLGNEIFVKSHQILFEQGLSDVDIHVNTWEDTKCFFFNGDKSDLPYDIFAASFYLISRYEEYLPHVQDEYGRFSAKDSLAYNNGFLQQPVVDIWAYKFRELLKSRFPDYEFKNQEFKVNPIIDVPTAFYFKHKGLMRTIGGTFSDIFRFRFRLLYQRYLVLLGFKRDPYDTFKWVINRQKTARQQFLIFFLIGDFSTFDKNININKKRFVSLIKSMADYSSIGLKVSFFAVEKFEILKREKFSMESIINNSLKASRNSFSKLNLPVCYRNLIDLEITEDYSMGYVNAMGFRAGTCTPFLFYDLDYEIQTPLMIHSYHLMDYTLLQFKSQLDKKETLQRFMNSIRKVNGTFVPIFHNYSFSEEERWEGFIELFNLILDSAHEDK